MKIDSVIFDMDGVLVDVSRSYRIAIEKTVNFLLERKGLSARITQKDVSVIKNLPGYNNDWDASYELYVSKADKTLQTKERRNILYKEIRDVFQTFYLGSKLFKKTERHNAPLNIARGLIWQERRLISKKLLETLMDMDIKLGVVTGRPRKEALFAIDNLSLQKFFKMENIIALEDAAKEKPDPEPLLKIIKIMKIKNPVYVGDSINDVVAAREAKMPCIFIGKEKLGDMQITNVNDLMEVLL